MHACCSICGDIFTGTHPELTYSTGCGHLFHYNCLMEWLDRSKTCPHCRTAVTKKNIFRLYFQLSSGLTQDTGTLENKIQSLNFQLSLQDTELKKIKEQAITIKEQNKGLRTKLIEAEEHVRNNETVVSSLQDQIKVLKVEIKSLREAGLQLKEVKKELSQYKKLDIVLNGSLSDAAETVELMKEVTDPTVLCACINTLKREVYNLKRKIQDMKGLLQSKESKILSLNSELQKLQEHSSVVERAFKKLKSDLQISEEENEKLRQRHSTPTLARTPTNSRSDLSEFLKENTNSITVDRKLRQFWSEASKPQLVTSPIIDLTQSTEKIIAPSSPVSSKCRYMGSKSKLLLTKPRLHPSKNINNVFDDSDTCYDGFGGHFSEETVPNKSAVQRIINEAKKTSKPPTKKAKVIDHRSKSSMLNFVTKNVPK